MFCTQCGSEAKPGQLFCTSCGAKIVAPVQNNQSYNPNQGYQNKDINKVQQGYQSNTYQNSTYQGYQPYGNYQNKTKKKNGKTILAIVLLLMFLGAVGAIGRRVVDFYEGFKQSEYYNDPQSKMELQDANDDALSSDSKEQFTAKETSDNTSTDPNDIFAGYQNLQYKNYSFAGVAYGEKALYVVPSGFVNDNTVLWNGKTAGEFADFVDSDVLEDGRTLNRKLFYDLISVYLVDPTLSQDPVIFENSMIYLTTFTNQFYDMDVQVEALGIPFTEQNRYRFKIKSYGNDDVWIADPTNNEFYFNNGKTEYNSSMYEDKTLANWLLAVEVFFEMEKEG